jgi:hypothetical protein
MGCAGLSQGCLGKFCMMHGTYLFGQLNALEAGLEPTAAAEVALAALKLSHCNVL